MFENDDSNLQTKFGADVASNIFKITKSKNHGITPAPWPPDFESLPYLRGRC